ncbi:hypothetical protein MRB53_000568 [Persea americana]|uniref:Uncharacterized protein n=1 Tax=Persea americana TaxID=3435 RepID=A0ACC2MPC7_PERAE|nr:hypothetical protein MRB53_000568 [Persea americana]
MEIFTETHKELAQERAKWLSNASQACSVVATLITTVAFATIASVPGGVHDHGDPVFQGKLAFNVFSASSFIALCFSSISVVMFLSILTSPYQDLDYSNHLPRKLIYGLASLFISIAAMFLSFFTGDLFVLDSKIKYVAYPIFILTLGVALPGFPVCYEFVKETVSKYPSRIYPHKLSF